MYPVGRLFDLAATATWHQLRQTCPESILTVMCSAALRANGTI